MDKEKENLSRRTFLKLTGLVGVLAAVEGISCYGKKFGLKIEDEDLRLLPSTASYPSPYPNDNLIPYELGAVSEPPLNT